MTNGVLPSTYPHFSAGWAVAIDAPFAYTKQVASDFGGTRNGMVIQWPKGIKGKGGITPQFGHVIDIAPTIYEITKLPSPKIVNGIAQDPIEGTSLAYTFNEAAAAESITYNTLKCLVTGPFIRTGGLPVRYTGRPGYRNP